MAQFYPTVGLSADRASRKALGREHGQLELLAIPPRPAVQQGPFIYGFRPADSVIGPTFFLAAIIPTETRPLSAIEHAKELLREGLSGTEDIVSSWYSWDQEEKVLRLFTFTSELDYDLETSIFRYYALIVEAHEDTDFELRVIPLNDREERTFLPPDSYTIFTNR
jgi:hypothetical protein